MTKLSIVWFQFSVGLILPWILQTLSLFTNFWVIDDGIKKGLFYQSFPNGTHILSMPDQASLGLQCTSVILLTLFLISGILTICCFGPSCSGTIYNDDDDTCISCCCCSFYCSIFLYVDASFLSLGGCARFGSLYPIETLGVSFYMNVASFLIIWLVCLALICDVICKRKDEDDWMFKTLLKEIYEDAM